MSDGGGLAPGELQRRAARGATWSTLSVALSLPLSICVSVVTARSLGSQEFARFAFLAFSVPLLLMVSDLGFARATTRAASQAFGSGDIAATRDILSKALGWNLLRLGPMSALTLVIARPGLEGAIAVVIALFLMHGAGGVVYSLQAENRGAAAAKLTFIQGTLVGVVTMAAAALGASGTDVWAISLLAGAILLPGWWFLVNPLLRRATVVPRLPRDLPDRFLAYGSTAFVLSLAGMLVFSRSEVVILQAFDEQQALAVFALAAGLALRLTTPVDTLLTPLVPALSALAHSHPDRLQPGFSRAFRLSAAAVGFLAAAAVVGTMLAAPVLFGPEYEGTGAAFAALAWVSLLQSSTQPYIAVAHALGRLGGLMRAYSIAFAADLALAVALIPPLGLWGAVIANICGGTTAAALAIRATPVTGTIRGAGVPIGRLVVVTVASAGVAFAIGLAGAAIHPALGALLAYGVGTCCFVGLGKLAGGLLLDTDASVLLDVLPARLALRIGPLIPIIATDRVGAAPAGLAGGTGGGADR